MIACAHCLLTFPERDAVRASIGGEARVFCCAGCKGVYELVHGEGLAAYYERRAFTGPGAPAPGPGQVADLAAFREHVRAGEEGEELELYVEGIRCASCVWLNERILERTPGVRYARVNYGTHRARVRWDPQAIDLAAVLSRIQAAGYQPRPWSPSEQQVAREAETRDLLIRLGTAGFLSSQLMIYQVALYAGYFQGIDALTRTLMEWISLGLTLPVYLYSGWPFLRATARGLRRLHFSMDALVALGSGAALIYSVWGMFTGGEVYFDTAAMIPTLVLVGRYIETVAKGRASEAVARLAQLAPREARLIEVDAGGREVTRSAAVSGIRPGQRVRVVPGERIPLDGEVIEGASEVDESLVTGESRPVAKAAGAAVIGGTMNGSGALVVKVTRVGEDTVLAGITRAVEAAQATRPRIQRIADRVVGVFVPTMLLLALSTVGAWLAGGAPLEQAIMTGISVVVIACPCALGLATPIAVIVATGAATTRGLLIKGGDVLENAARITDVLLDKTGTLTQGRPVLQAVIPFGCTREEALLLAAAVERRSEHHVGRAIAEAAASVSSSMQWEVTDFRAVPGRGVVASVRAAVALEAVGAAAADLGGARVLVGNRALLADAGVALPEDADRQARALEARGETTFFLARGADLLGLFAVVDVVREEAREAVGRLRGLGLRVALVSGDAAATTARVAEGLGLEAVGEASPVEKREVVARRQASGRQVLFVGDGINDAPALMQAEVGAAMGRGTDVTLESAAVVLVRGDLRLVADLVSLARKTSRVIGQNVFWAFAYNVISIPLAMAGILHPIVAAGAMATSSIFVVLNSLRARRGVT